MSVRIRVRERCDFGRKRRADNRADVNAGGNRRRFGIDKIIRHGQIDSATWVVRWTRSHTRAVETEERCVAKSYCNVRDNRILEQHAEEFGLTARARGYKELAQAGRAVEVFD